MHTSPLDARVLVLNRDYAALAIVSVRKAFALLVKEIAEVVALEENRYLTYDFDSWVKLSELRSGFEETEEWVRTVSRAIRVPRIVRLMRCNARPRPRVRFNRRNIFARDGNRCQYCGERFPTAELSIDHVLPRSRGGKTVWDNIVCACTDCNVRKGRRLPDEAGMHLIRAPFTPRWSPMVAERSLPRRYRSWQKFLTDAYWSVELSS